MARKRKRRLGYIPNEVAAGIRDAREQAEDHCLRSAASKAGPRSSHPIQFDMIYHGCSLRVRNVFNKLSSDLHDIFK